MIERPAQEAIDCLTQAVLRSKRASTVRFPQQFARDRQGKNPDPPLARLLRGHGEVRLKVFMTVLMMATAAPHAKKVAAADLATMLDLPDPQKAGSRRVNKAFRDLVEMGLVARTVEPGHVPETKVLDPAGSGEGWSDLKLPNPYITMPVALWRRGWFVALSGRAIALLVVLRELTNGRSAPNGTWVDGIRKRQYGLSDDTWTRSVAELREAGLLEVREHIQPSRGEPRRRNLYTLRLERLENFDPGDVPVSEETTGSEARLSSEGSVEGGHAPVVPWPTVPGWPTP